MMNSENLFLEFELSPRTLNTSESPLHSRVSRLGGLSWVAVKMIAVRDIMTATDPTVLVGFIVMVKNIIFRMPLTV